MMTRYRMLRALLLMLSWLASGAQATIFWDDEMESGNSGYGIVAGAMSYDTAVKFSGNGSVRLNYSSLCYPDSNAQANCGGFMDRTFTPTGTFYRRFYIRLSAGFTVSDVFTKLMRSDTTGPTSNWWVLGCCGSKQLLVADQNVPTIGTTMNYYTNFTMKDATWYCVETLEQLNTPGVANGLQQAWVDGVQVMNRADIQYRQVGDTSLYNNNRLYRQTGLGSIWYDRIAVGDTRIGCAGGAPPPSDIQAPSIPAGLNAQAASSSQINLAWNASSDNVGVTGYRIFRGGAQIATTAGTSYSNTGLTAATAYSYTVAAYDVAGNASAQSAAASATTFPPPLPTDMTPPTVSITAPANGASVSGSAVSITADAADAGPAGETPSGVAGVQFRIDGSPLGAEDTSAPYAAALNTTLYSNGAHTLTAVARDVAGHTTTSVARTININNAGAVGAVSNLAVPQIGSNGATLSFTEVDDGTGQPAKYDIRFQSPTINWGSASSVAQGTCATPLTGTQIGATKTCTVLGLSPSTGYQFQLVPFRGTMNVDAVFGAISNVAGATTSVGVDVLPPAKPKNLRMQ